MVAEEVDHRASAQEFTPTRTTFTGTGDIMIDGKRYKRVDGELVEIVDKPHPLVGKCRIRGCSGKLRDHTPDGSDGPDMTLKCEKCGFTFLFTPAPSQFSRRERRGRA